MKRNTDIKPITSSTLVDLIALDLKSLHEDYYYIYRIILETGVYVSILLDLKVKDLRGKDYIEFRSSKRYDHHRTAAFSDRLKKELDVFFEGKSDESYAFSGCKSGDKLQISVFKRILHRISKQHGINPPITVNSLIRTYKYHEFLKNPSGSRYFSKSDSYESILDYFGLDYPDKENEVKPGSIKETFYRDNLLQTVKERLDNIFKEISRLTERPDTMDNEYYENVLNYLNTLDSVTDAFEKLKK